MIAQRWLDMAKQSEQAARLLEREKMFRSSVSRAYYAAQAAAHAILLRRGHTPPQEGNWANPGLGDVLGTSLRTVHPQIRKEQARDYRMDVVRCWTMRLDADYRAIRSIGDVESRAAIRSCGRLVRLAESVLA
jgi:hypothetical protein